MDSEKIKVSVIIPVYGVEKYVERCVRSLMEQSMADGIEFIFVDDRTPDRSVEIIERTVSEYPQRKNQVKILHHEKNRGLTCSRNNGLKEAKGEYIYYCDSDDRTDVTLVEKLYRKAKTGNLDFAWCDFYYEKQNGITEAHQTVAWTSDKTAQLKSYISEGWTVVWNILCRREIYEKFNIKSNESISFCEDYELTIRLLACSKRWGKVEEPLYFYNQTNTSSIVSSSLNNSKRQKTIKDEITACKSVYDFITEHGYKDALMEQLSWRNLKAKRGLIYPKFHRKEFKTLWPEAIRYIDTLSFCSRTDILSMKLASNKILWPLVYGINGIRKLAERLK